MRALRLLLLASCATLAGCSSGADDASDLASGEDRISCALGGSVEFSEACAVERTVADGRLTLVVRHPDGAFRRFAVVSDGRGLVVADGAEEALTRVDGDKLAVTVAEDRYLFPATVKRPS
ncbi:hypothetical protein [Novosphingobium sp. M1R2S20]|uniref:Lipoprotein n=1 Tax=Novosphingobium rhizovicinum TaxID=3228928 RepID=A0ABV3R6G2_9SPHN